MKDSEKPLPSLTDLQRKIDEAEAESEGHKAPAESAKIGASMNLGMELLAGVGVGGILGYFIDKAAGTLPVFFIIFFFIGFAAGLRNIMRKSKEGNL